MELFTHTVPEVRFDYPDPDLTGLYAYYSLNGGSQRGLSLNLQDGYATTKLPYQLYDGKVEVDWYFTIPGSGTYKRKVYYEVVTPLLSLDQTKAIIGVTSTDDEAVAAEASARYIIQAYTGQSFGKYVGTISVTGSGDSTLRMPRRLISMNNINNNVPAASWVTLRGGGWFLTSHVMGPPPLRADFDGWHQLPDSGVITAPPRWVRPYMTFAAGVEYVIDGEWGWDYVPASVVEASKLLVNDYACSDSIYRDRFITSISGPDWQFRFNEGAFTSTGNVRADQLLGEFKLRRGWMVI